LALQKSVKVTGGKNADTWAQMAVLLDEAGRRAEADAAFKQAVNLDPRLARPDLLVSALKWKGGARRSGRSSPRGIDRSHSRPLYSGVGYCDRCRFAKKLFSKKNLLPGARSLLHCAPRFPERAG